MSRHLFRVTAFTAEILGKVSQQPNGECRAQYGYTVLISLNLHEHESESFDTARRDHRVPLRTPIEVWTHGTSALGETLNVGAGGLLIECRRKLQVGTHIRVLFNLPTGHTISTECEVLHVHAGHQAGLLFLKLEEAARAAICEFIDRMVTYTRRGVRITKRLHVMLRQTDADAALSEMAETIVLSRHGGMLATRAPFAEQDVVYLWWPQGKRGVNAKIVSRRESAAGLLDLGFEFLSEENFWRLDFPEDPRHPDLDV
jgi:hypothetical protein